MQYLAAMTFLVVAMLISSSPNEASEALRHAMAPARECIVPAMPLALMPAYIATVRNAAEEPTALERHRGYEQRRSRATSARLTVTNPRAPQKRGKYASGVPP